MRQLAGERYQRREEGQQYRWGGEKGFLVVDGQKTPITRPRLQSDEGREQPLGSYELFRRGAPLDAAVWDKLMLGLSTRNYGQAVREFADAYGLEKSAVSDHFIRVSRSKLRELLERPLDGLSLCAICIDGVEYHSQHLIVALGLTVDGQKSVLGLARTAEPDAQESAVAGGRQECLATACWPAHFALTSCDAGKFLLVHSWGVSPGVFPCRHDKVCGLFPPSHRHAYPETQAQGP